MKRSDNMPRLEDWEAKKLCDPEFAAAAKDAEPRYEADRKQLAQNDIAPCSRCD